MIFRQFLHESPVAVSYLIGCGGKGLAAIVDPCAEPDAYIAAAQAGGMRITLVVDTHVHADHVSTARALAEQTGAYYVLFQGADVAPPFRGVADGETLSLGNVSARVLHTPGHTPEHISLVVTDRSRGEEPWFVLTGHTLMVGDLGRTELATSATAGAKDLFASVQKLKGLADHLQVFPGAYAGSACGRSLSGNPMSTIGFERRHNKAFRIDDEQAFIDFMLADMPPPPAHAARLRAMNAGHVVAP